MVGVGIYGTGWVTGEHIKSFTKCKESEVVAICGRSADKAKAKALECGLPNIRVYTDYSEMLRDPNVHAVSLCTPPNMHPEQTILAAQAGKHVLIEKAVANDPISLGKMMKAVNSSGVKTVVSFVLRWNPQFQWIKEMMNQKNLGDIFYAEVDYWHNIGPQYGQYMWNTKKEIAGSVYLSAGCHAVDAMRYFMVDEITEVTAYANQIDTVYEYMTNMVGILKFANGAIGKTSASFDVVCPYAFNIDLLGTKGSIRDNHIYAPATFPGARDWITIPTIRPDSGDVTDHPFDGEIAHFIDCILSDTESHVNLTDAAKTHAVCYALERSATEGRSVQLSEIVAEISAA